MILEAFDRFWRQQPALLYAGVMGLAAAAAIRWNPIYTIPLIALVWPIFFYCRHRQLALRILLALAIGISFYGYVITNFVLPPLSKKTIPVRATFQVDSISLDSPFYGKRWVYRGTLKSCYSIDDGSLIAKNLPVVMLIPFNSNRPEANKAYWVKGVLKQGYQEGGYTLSIKKGSAWSPIPYTFSMAEMRYHVKQWVKSYISEKVTDPRSARFLCGIATGDFTDKLMQFEFSRFGLQHIMAISGFHFAIVAGILSLFFRLFFPKKKAVFLLVFALCSYYLFLGPTPSIMRAWLMILLMLIGVLLEKRPISLNGLGVAAMIIIMLDPFIIFRVGFLFSVLVTASILMNYGIIDALLRRLLQLRPFSEVVEMDLLSQHGYCAIAFIRGAFSLALAVNVIALPLALYFFHKFPLLGFIFNLFFPFLVSFSIFLLIIGSLTAWIPVVSGAIHTMNGHYTSMVLSLAYNIPQSLDYYLRTEVFTLEILFCYVVVIGCGSVMSRHLLEREKEESRDFAFV